MGKKCGDGAADICQFVRNLKNRFSRIHKIIIIVDTVNSTKTVMTAVHLARLEKHLNIIQYQAVYKADSQTGSVAPWNIRRIDGAVVQLMKANIVAPPPKVEPRRIGDQMVDPFDSDSD